MSAKQKKIKVQKFSTEQKNKKAMDKYFVIH